MGRAAAAIGERASVRRAVIPASVARGSASAAPWPTLGAPGQALDNWRPGPRAQRIGQGPTARTGPGRVARRASTKRTSVVKRGQYCALPPTLYPPS